MGATSFLGKHPAVHPTLRLTPTGHECTSPRSVLCSARFPEHQSLGHIESPAAQRLGAGPQSLTSDIDANTVNQLGPAHTSAHKSEPGDAHSTLAHQLTRGAHRLALSPHYQSAPSECIKRVHLQPAQSDDIPVSKVKAK